MNTNDPYHLKRRTTKKIQEKLSPFSSTLLWKHTDRRHQSITTKWMEKPQHYSLLLNQLPSTTIVWHQQVWLTIPLHWLSQRQFLNQHVLRTLSICEEHSRHYFPYNMNKNCELLRKKYTIIKFITQCFHGKTEWLI